MLGLAGEPARLLSGASCLLGARQLVEETPSAAAAFQLTANTRLRAAPTAPISRLVGALGHEVCRGAHIQIANYAVTDASGLMAGRLDTLGSLEALPGGGGGGGGELAAPRSQPPEAGASDAPGRERRRDSTQSLRRPMRVPLGRLRRRRRRQRARRGFGGESEPYARRAQLDKQAIRGRRATCRPRKTEIVYIVSGSLSCQRRPAATGFRWLAAARWRRRQGRARARRRRGRTKTGQLCLLFPFMVGVFSIELGLFAPGESAQKRAETIMAAEKFIALLSEEAPLG